MVQPVVVGWAAVVVAPDVAGLFDGALLVDLELPQAARAKTATSKSYHKPSTILLISSPFRAWQDATPGGTTLTQLYDRWSPNGFPKARKLL
jgi:hypothetical protein